MQLVIPESRGATNPESMTIDLGYGFRALGRSGLAPE